MNFKKNDWLKIFLIFLITASIMMRCFNFSDLLLLKGDQVRDLKLTDRVMEGGIGELSLLGPRAGGTNLRLGPAFYYFQYVSAKVMGENTPASAALPNLIFSIASIFLAYLLLRKYFSQNWSLALTASYASSFLAIEYSRFTWNPNSLPFFTLLFLYSLMQVFAEEKKHRWLWVTLVGLSLAIAGQLHFTNFIALPIFLVFFLFFQRKKIVGKIRLWDALIFLSVIILFYIPVILSDVINHGDNLKLFFQSIGAKKPDHSFFANLSREAYYFGKYFFRILTGYFGSEKIIHHIGSIFVFAGFIFNWLAYKKEDNEERKTFLLAIFLWATIFFLLYIPLAYDINKPRFFLSLMIVAFAWLGLMGKYFWQKKSVFAKTVFTTIFCIFLFSNIIAASLWLFELSVSQQKALNVEDTVILKTKKDKAWWTWGIIYRASIFMSSACEEQKIYYHMSKRKLVEFGDVFEYAHESSGDKRPIGISKEIPGEFNEACYFLIEKSGEKNKNNLEIEKQASFGDITIAMVKAGLSSEIFAEVDKEDSQDIDSGENTEAEDTGDGIIVEELLYPRTYWKDVF